jgi:hypothetical protein
MSVCNHLPGTFCHDCYSIAATPHADGTLSTGVLPQSTSPAEADILKQLQELRDEVEEIQEDLRYLLSHVAPAGSRRRYKKRT